MKAINLMELNLSRILSGILFVTDGRTKMVSVFFLLKKHKKTNNLWVVSLKMANFVRLLLANDDIVVNHNQIDSS